MKSSEALRLARRMIESGERIHVCSALFYATSREQNTKVQKRLARLFGYTSVTQWLHAQGYARQWDNYSSRMRDYRLRWIDWMIEGYEAKGD